MAKYERNPITCFTIFIALIGIASSIIGSTISTMDVKINNLTKEVYLIKGGIEWLKEKLTNQKNQLENTALLIK